MYCIYWEKSIPDDATFCSYCHTSFIADRVINNINIQNATV